MPGIVYILTHPVMDGLIKIGRTHDLAERMRILYNSSVPSPFACHFAAWVSNAEAVEGDLHEIFGDRRINPRREFFTADPHRVALALQRHASFQEEVIEIEEQDPQDIEAANRAGEVMERQANFDFVMVDIPEGAVLTFVANDEITCCVAQRRPPRVEYNNENLSLTAAAMRIRGSHTNVNGTQYWMYQGETIWERRQRLGDA